MEAQALQGEAAHMLSGVNPMVRRHRVVRAQQRSRVVALLAVEVLVEQIRARYCSNDEECKGSPSWGSMALRKGACNRRYIMSFPSLQGSKAPTKQ